LVIWTARPKQFLHLQQRGFNENKNLRILPAFSKHKALALMQVM
jgi:hypothetical protein